jgi:hypothetical protein
MSKAKSQAVKIRQVLFVEKRKKRMHGETCRETWKLVVPQVV